MGHYPTPALRGERASLARDLGPGRGRICPRSGGLTAGPGRLAAGRSEVPTRFPLTKHPVGTGIDEDKIIKSNT